VIRSTPEGVHFYINPDRPDEEFIKDWTAYHELSHLFIPYPGQRSIWVSEGMASYYQNVLQFRAGLLTEQQAWQKLYNGFERGRLDSRGDGLTLGELSAVLREKHAFMRAYWSGALYFLEADIALRRHSDGRMTMDDVLRAYGNCCLEATGSTTGPELVRAFDRIAEAEIFVPLFERYDGSAGMPDYQAVMKAAGITVVNNEVRIDPETPPTHSLQRRQAARENGKALTD
jgi:predicted metalloprotease with PDZ domain